MASTFAAIADLLTTWLNNPARNWRVSNWTAERSWAPSLELKQLDDRPQVDVVPDVLPGTGATEEDTTRDTEEFVGLVYIGVRQKYSADGVIPNSWVDERAGLAEEIADQVRNLDFTDELDGVKRVFCETVTIDPLIDPGELRQRRTALSVIETTWRVWR